MPKEVKLSFPERSYTSPDILMAEHSAKELRAEYSRLRSIARKRLERLGSSKYKAGETYKHYKGRFTALPDIKTTRTVARKLVEVQKFLGLRTGTVSGTRQVRRERIQALKDRGYSFINEKNFDLFTDFMEYNKALRQGGAYDSERVLQLVREVSRKNLDPEQIKDEFEFWVNNVETLKTVPEPPSRKGTRWQKFDASEYFRREIQNRNGGE